MKSSLNIVKFTAGFLTVGSIIFQSQISMAVTVKGSYITKTLLGYNSQQINYEYENSLGVAQQPVYTVWQQTNDSNSAITRQNSDTRTISLTAGAEWNVAKISFTDSYSKTDTATYTISPKSVGTLTFQWLADLIVSGKTRAQDCSNYTGSCSPSGSISENQIGTGPYNYAPSWRYSEVPVPEPLSIFGTITALGFGAILKKRELSKRQKIEATKA
ncbi:PEP-CTERM sorting domain-containing protein [Cylindrospermum stagnale]|nr:PEP-CTERM sorting domain-containing protein [Cylindrospermum stagnale]